MIAYVNLAGTGDAYVLARWGSVDVEARYFPSDARFKRWFRWHAARNPSAEWRYVGDAEMNTLLSEEGLTMAAFDALTPSEKNLRLSRVTVKKTPNRP